MLDIKLEWAMEPEEMQRQGCGMCGEWFQPEAVLASIVVDDNWLHEAKLCEVCLEHLADRAERGSGPGQWAFAWSDYHKAREKYTEPKFPSVEAVMKAEEERPSEDFINWDIYDRTIRLG